VKDKVQDFGYAAGWAVVKAMPQGLATALFRTGADRAAAKNGPGVQRLARNLTCVLGEPASPELVKQAMRSYARYWMEAFRMPNLSREQQLKSFRLDGIELLLESHKAGTGCVIALPHAGNWDAAGAHVAAHGVPITTVAERLRPESLYKRFLAFRESLGMNIIPLTGGQPPIDVLVKRLKENAHIVPLLADRDLSARGVEVSFFGGTTRMPAGPALLAIRTGAPLFIVNMWYEQEKPCGQVVGPIAAPAEGALDVRVKRLTQLIADELAKGIAANPADWHMLQKLWLKEPPIRSAE
jgi:lauroyl/myristoyl acyltransferase